MNWLIDEMLPPATAEELRAKGHAAVAVADLDRQGAADAELFDLAARQQRILVTENFSDYAALVEAALTSDASCTAVVFVRTSSMPAGGALASHLATQLDDWASRNPDPYLGLHWP